MQLLDPVIKALVGQPPPDLTPEQRLKLWQEQIRKGWRFDPRKF